MTNVKYLVLLIILYLLSGCSEETLINYIDPPAPEERAQGVIKSRRKIILRKFPYSCCRMENRTTSCLMPTKEVFMSMLHCKSLSTKNKNCLSASSVPDRLKGVKIWASIVGYDEEFLLADFETVPVSLNFTRHSP